MTANRLSSTRAKLNRRLSLCTAVLAFTCALSQGIALAGQATSGATATSNPWGPGSAAANAAYLGDGQGVARTQTRSGRVNTAQGVAFGVDNDGVTFSASHALAGRNLPALASTLNIAIDFDGSVSTSGGLSLAEGGSVRSVQAGGVAQVARFGPAVSKATAVADAKARGRAQARTWSHSTPAKTHWR